MKSLALIALLMLFTSGCATLFKETKRLEKVAVVSPPKLTLSDVPKYPICIDIKINTEFNKKSKLGLCYYEQFDTKNISVKASGVGKKVKKVELFLINGKYILQKGDIPKGAEFKYLVGYMANLQLIQKLISDGMKKAPPVGNGSRTFIFSDDVNPFEIRILNKKIVYPAPWSVKGTVKPRSDEKGFDFDINFKVSWGKEPNIKIQNSTFRGSFHQKEKIIGDDILFGEWEQYSLNGKGQLLPVKDEIKYFENLW